MENQSRRKFIIQSLLAAGIAGSEGFSILSPTEEKITEIGLIPTVIDSNLKENWKSALQEVAEIGYAWLEFGKYYGPDPAEFKKFMKEIGLKPLAGGGAMAGMKNPEQLKRMIDSALELDKKYLVCYWPWMDNGNNKKLDDFKRAADDLNEIGKQCNQSGIIFAFHNHDKEFVPVEGHRWGYEVILEQTYPQQVSMLMDLYWITKGAGDPIYFMERYPERFSMFHVKDMDNTPSQLYTCPGYGIIDFPKIFAHARKAGVKYYTVEIDQHENGMQCLRDSYNYLKNLRF